MKLYEKENSAPDLDEAAVEGQVVPDGVLPGSLVRPVVRKPLHDELVDARQSDALLGALLDRHGDESDVAGRKRQRSSDDKVSRDFVVFL